MIYRKREWIHELCQFLDWPVEAKVQDELAAEIDVFPETEQAKQHIRQVHPGNYLKKLRPDTIEFLSDHFSDELGFFKYQAA